MAKKPLQFCVVQIGIDGFLMSLPDGMKMVEIMTRALPVERSYGGDALCTYKVDHSAGPPPVSLHVLRPGELEDTSDQPWRKRRRLQIEGPQ